jgi:TRAP-type C4-dicarboxylate transport system substrate-binding protein
VSIIRFIKLASIAAALGAAVPVGPAGAQTIELKLSHFVPPQHAFHKWVTGWAQKLEQDSKGRLKITIYPNGQLVGPPNRQFDAARNGVTDIAWTLHGVTPGRYPMTELANLPFAWPGGKDADIVETAKRMTELAPKYFAAEHTGLKILFMSMANPIVVYSKVPINKLEDFKGLKIRYASITNKVMLDQLGAATMLIPPPESQDALAKGIAQAATFPHEAGLAYDLASVVKYAIHPAMASATFAMVMNPAKYNGLPADLRALIDQATGVKAAVEFGQAWAAQEKHALEIETKQKGLQVINLPDGEVAKLKEMAKKQTDEAIAALEKQNKPARAFMTEFLK